MKRFLLSFAVITALAAGPLMAQTNPFIGTWKLNVAKSKFEPGPAPKSQTRAVVADGDGAKYSFEGVRADGTAISYSFTVKYDGKDYPITGSGAPGEADSIAIKRVGSNKAEATFKKGGKEVGKSVVEVSKDGTVTTVKGKGKTPDGKDYSSESVYDKQ
ncbi:MAG TPA: hypothetical protein VKH63_17110 [Candidatus Acidoferrum sp.]|jgi:hypothetical protein|nr:hypothetical protein [Candidatus Acidoferrum sp.]